MQMLCTCVGIYFIFIYYMPQKNPKILVLIFGHIPTDLEIILASTRFFRQVQNLILTVYLSFQAKHIIHVFKHIETIFVQNHPFFKYSLGAKSNFNYLPFRKTYVGTCPKNMACQLLVTFRIKYIYLPKTHNII